MNFRPIRQVRNFIKHVSSSMTGRSSIGLAGVNNPLIPSPSGRGLG